MTVARTIDPTSLPSLPTGSQERSGAAPRSLLRVAIIALIVALLGGAYAYFGAGAGDDYPDATQQWTD